MGRDGADSDWQREHGMAIWEDGQYDTSYMRGDDYTPPQKEPRKIELQITEEELIEDLARDIFGNAFNSVHRYNTRHDFGGGDGFCDGLGLDNHGELGDDYLEFESHKHMEYEVTIPHLSRILNRAGLPIKDREYENWLVWNDRQKRFEVAYRPDYWRVVKKGPYHWQPTSVTAETVEILQQGTDAIGRLLARALATTNHGQKPLLVHHRDLDALNHKQPISFTAPDSISDDETDQYVIAYYNNSGEILTIPLPEALQHDIHIATRSGIYQHVHDGLRNLYRYPNLHRNAFSMAKAGAEPAPTYFRLKPAGTIYEPAIEQIPAKDRTRYPVDEILITSGGHPLEVNLDDGLCPTALTTTPGLYQFARQTIEQFAYLVAPRDVQPG